MLSLLLALLTCVSCFQVSQTVIQETAIANPKLAAMMQRAMDDPEGLAHDLAQSFPLAPTFKDIHSNKKQAAGALPIVVTHGMGDSCFNGGMKSITKAAGDHVGVYSVCIPGGDNEITDTISGFLTTMNKNVDIFAEKVRADPKLAGGFDAFGLSQGNSVLRGYITRYNDPPVRNYLSIHGTVNGVAGIPNCNPVGILPGICDTIAEALGDLAYTSLVQSILFQANYFRDPLRIGSKAYKEHSQIAGWNNENPDTVNATYVSNFNKVQSYSMIKAMKDSMVYPNAAEWWGFFEEGSFNTTQTMKDTTNYKQNLFGLQTADQAGKIRFNSTAGNHLQFTVEQLTSWLDLYFH